jgi:hypothetical protein
MFLLLMFATILSEVGSGGATLTGIVRDEDGSTLADAKVHIYTAKPRVGPATTCPSCYRDCAKSTTTDAEGHFSIEQLDTGLLFRVLVMAPDRRSHLTDFTDPTANKIDVKLKHLPTDLPHDQMVAGRILNDQGQPLAGAVVSPTGAKTADRSWWGQTPGVDQASITDAQGRFVITSRDPKLGLYLRVSAPGHACVTSHFVDFDGSEHEIQMQSGAVVFGKLMFEGQPIKNRSVGIVQRNRSAGEFAGERVLATDHTGSFQFTDLQPSQSYVLYTLCEPNSTGNENASVNDLVNHIRPVLKTRSLVTADAGGVTQLGELELEPGLTFSGQVIFPDDSKPPGEVSVRLSRNPAWDWCEAVLTEDGEFTFYGLPAEVYSVSVKAAGFEIDAGQLRYQTIGPSEFGIRLPSQGHTTIQVSIPMKAKSL